MAQSKYKVSLNLTSDFFPPPSVFIRTNCEYNSLWIISMHWSIIYHGEIVYRASECCWELDLSSALAANSPSSKYKLTDKLMKTIRVFSSRFFCSFNIDISIYSQYQYRAWESLDDKQSSVNRYTIKCQKVLWNINAFQFSSFYFISKIIVFMKCVDSVELAIKFISWVRS